MTKEAWVGIDVGATALSVAIVAAPEKLERLEVSNDARGHRQLRHRLKQVGTHLWVCLEATGIYHVDLALGLHAMPGVAVMVANPRSTKDFARATMRRAKTDRVDAAMLVEYVRRMPFQAWTPPSSSARMLQALARRIEALTQTRAQERNRLHAARACAALGPALQRASHAHITFLTRLLRELTAEARRLIGTEPALGRRFAQLQSVPGIGERSALRLLAELTGLPADMTVRQWVAHAGLDPRPFESGTSVRKAPRISRTGNAQLRAALYMPALVAVRCDTAARHFYTQLLARQKKPKQALVAVMRKLLHAIYGMFRHDALYEPTKCYPLAA